MINLDSIEKTVTELKEFERTNKILRYEPYKFQSNFHHAKGDGKFVCVPSDEQKVSLAIHRALQAANKTGKTLCGGAETAFHLTGLYPDWWQGHKWFRPTTGICASTTNETTRDRCQDQLFGDPTDEALVGTGMVPKDAIGKRSRKAGVPNAWETVLIKHVTGGLSKVFFKCYEQGPKKFMGYGIDWAWCDEEPPSDIWSQILRGLFASNGMAYITYTPEDGVTEVVIKFMNELSPGQALIGATWDDAPHMTPETIAQKLASLPPMEREMRSKGVPAMGSGLIFPIPDEDIWIEPFKIPNHFSQVIGCDFGWDHPFAAILMAHDRELDKVYITDCFRESKMTIPVASDRLKAMGGHQIPVVWPHDGMVHDKQSGKPLATLYREKGIAMHPDFFSNPPGPGQKEGQGGQGVERPASVLLSQASYVARHPM